MSKDFWCSCCEQAVDAFDASKNTERYNAEFWGSRATSTTTFYYCPDCQDELEDYEGQDAEDEADDEQA